CPGTPREGNRSHRGHLRQPSCHGRFRRRTRRRLHHPRSRPPPRGPPSQFWRPPHRHVLRHRRTFCQRRNHHRGRRLREHLLPRVWRAASCDPAWRSSPAQFASAPGGDKMKTVIAIDGPAASGKSSVARELARRHGFAYVNSGHMYRALTWLVLRANAIPDNEESVMRVLDATCIECGIRNGESYFMLDGEDPSADLRRDDINRNVSAVSVHPGVRNLLLSRLRGLAEEHDLVMEGRDIGSAVFPNTPWKF